MPDESIKSEKFRGDAADPDPTGDCITNTYLGVEASCPACHQSGCRNWQKCPRYYLLRSRYGLVPKGKFPKRAPRRGTMFHKFMQDYMLGEPEAFTINRIGEDIDKWKQQAIEAECDFDEIARSSADCERDLQLARAMAACVQLLHPKPKTLIPLGVELKLQTPGNFPLPKLAGTVDLIALHEDTGKVSIYDYKATGNKAEFLTRGPAYDPQRIIYEQLALGWLDKMFADGKIPVGPEALQSFELLSVQFPTILFCDKDRDFKLVDYKPRTGPNAGTLQKRKEYVGEPKFENYLERVRSQYLGTGKYADEFDSREMDPLIRQSSFMYRPNHLIDMETKIFLEEMRRAARCRPDLFRYPKYRVSCVQNKTPCEFLDLCETDPTGWKTIVSDRFQSIPLNEDDIDDDE